MAVLGSLYILTEICTGQLTESMVGICAGTWFELGFYTCVRFLDLLIL
jgi:hypothetical protein